MPRKKPTKVSGNYASGIAIPFRADGDGGLVLEEGDAYIRSQALATVSPNFSENPFQDLGNDESAIFQNPDDPDWKRVVRRRVERQFRELETNRLARLVRVDFGKADGSGDFGLTIAYINLESTVGADVSVSIQADGGTARQVPGFTGRSN